MNWHTCRLMYVFVLSHVAIFAKADIIQRFTVYY